MTQFLRDKVSDSEEVVSPLMLDGTYLSRNFATLGPSMTWTTAADVIFFVLFQESLSCKLMSIYYFKIFVSIGVFTSTYLEMAKELIFQEAFNLPSVNP